MKAFSYLLSIIIVIISMTNISYAAQDTLPPNPRWVFDCHGTHTGVVEDMPLTYERTFLKSIILDSTKSNNYILNYENFYPGKRFKQNWDARVRDLKKDAHATIIFTDMAGNDTTIILVYYAILDTIRPDLDFGILSIGQTKELDCWFVNKGSTIDEILEMNFKNNDIDFEILDLYLPFYIFPNDSVKIKVKFNAPKAGTFTDSLGALGCCYCSFKNFIQVKATVKAPVIDVTSCNFGDVEVNKEKHGSFKLFNISDVELVISGYKLPNYSSNFIVELPEISVNNPLKLYPRQYFSFEVIFLPTQEMEYNDSIVFISNTTKEGGVDSVAELYGRGVYYPKIDVSDAEWGYVVRNIPKIKNITVRNIGYKELRITGFYIPPNTFFKHLITREINKDNPLILEPGESWNFDVEFCAPTENSRSCLNYVKFFSNTHGGDSLALFKVDSVLVAGAGDDSKTVDGIEFFPNPIDDYLLINFKEDSRKPDFVRLLDSFGNVVYENRNIIEKNLKINTSELPSGMYFLQIGNVGTRRVVVVH